MGKYETEEERKKARRESQARYYRKNRERIIARNKERYRNHFEGLRRNDPPEEAPEQRPVDNPKGQTLNDIID